LGLGNATTVKDYFAYLRDSFLFFLLPRFSFSVRQQVMANKKIYIIDTALGKLLGFRFTEDNGRFLENTVFIELQRRGQEVFYYSGEQECDFLVRNNGRVSELIQVTDEMRQASTRKREFAGLLAAMQEYKLAEGLILTRDEIGEELISKEGKKYKIIIKPVAQWLSE
jgi:predicted AAA+ superfamily ATPase